METPDIKVILDKANIEEGLTFNITIIQKIMMNEPGAINTIQEWFHIPKRTNKPN